MFSKPTTRLQNDAATKEFTRLLGVLAREHFGAEIEGPMASGNASEGDDAYIITAEVDGLVFNVEVFGPYFEAQKESA